MCRKKLMYPIFVVYLLALTAESSADPNLLLWYKFNGSQGAHLPSPITDNSGNNIQFTKYTEGAGSVKYGESNPIVAASTTSADFDPCAGLYRLDPCAPEEMDLLRLAGYQYTIEMWIKIENLGDADTFLIGKRGSWNIQINDPQGAKQLRWVHDGNQIGQDNTAVEGQWTHIAAIYDHPNESEHWQKFYINGELIDSGSYDGLNPADNNNPVTIACEELEAGGYGGFYQGLIDEIRIFDVALDICESLIEPGPEWPSCPSPADSEQNVNPNGVVLTWTPGTLSTSHKVYFGTDLADVNTLHPSALIYEGPSTSLPPLDLDNCTTYYWRVVGLDGGAPWVGKVWSFTTTCEIVDPSLLLWYKFDETTPNTVAHDSSGHGKHGAVVYGDPNWDADGGFHNGCLVFNNDTAVLVPTDALDNINDEITVSLWLKDAYQQDWDNWAFDAGFDGENGPYHMQVLFDGTAEELLWRAGNNSNDVLTCDWNDITNPRCWWPGEWHWFIFVKDESQDQISIYVDCALAASSDHVDNTLINLRGAPFKIGAATWHSDDLVGKMDDFRIYDYAVSEGDIAMWCYLLDPLALAWAPEPDDGEVNVPRDANLTWMPGDYALQHRVFFGTSWQDVDSMADPCATKGLGYELYDPGLLDLDTTYYWRIDEVNGPNTWKGCTWNFTTANYIVVDDFQSYASESNLLDRWCDQWCQELGRMTGSWLTLVTEPNYPVHAGTQAVEYWYDTNDVSADLNYAEAWMAFDQPQNWTQASVKILTLFFYGDPNNNTNDTEQMYVGVEDSCGLYAEIRYADDSEDMNDLKIEQWQRWDIALRDFNDANYAAVPNDVALTDVNRLYIGFGKKRNPMPAGSGHVYFDDIRLYPPICLPGHGPAADFTGDCFVDYKDLRIMGADWLRTDVNFAVVQEPCDANLVGHWTLDEGDGNTGGDSSDYNNPGTLEGGYSWVPGRIGPYAVEFAGGRVLVPDDGNTPELRPLHQVTVSAWVYFTQSQNAARVVVKGQNDQETYEIEIDGTNHFVFVCRDTNGNRYSVGETGNIWPGDWIHLAGTIDGDTNTVKSYVNGQLDDSRDDANFVEQGCTLAQDVDSGLAIGSRAEALHLATAFNGTVDEVRVYDCGLSPDEAAWLATDGTRYIPLTSPANIYDQESPGQKAVNLKDLALLANDWLKKKLWPQ